MQGGGRGRVAASKSSSLGKPFGTPTPCVGGQLFKMARAWVVRERAAGQQPGEGSRVQTVEDLDASRRARTLSCGPWGDSARFGVGKWHGRLCALERFLWQSQSAGRSLLNQAIYQSSSDRIIEFRFPRHLGLPIYL